MDLPEGNLYIDMSVFKVTYLCGKYRQGNIPVEVLSPLYVLSDLGQGNKA